MVTQFSLPYQIGRNLLLLEELLDVLAERGIEVELLLRASPDSELPRLLAHGTTRGGFAVAEPWRDGSLPGQAILHEDVLFGTTPDDIRAGEVDPARSTSFKKLPAMDAPMVQVYQRAAFAPIADRQWLFRDPTRKRDALLAVCRVDKQAAIEGWFSEAAGLRYRQLAARVRGGSIVEVGCWKGLSASYVARLAVARGTRLVCIDAWQGSSDSFNSGYQQRLAQEDVQASCAANLARLGLTAQLLRAASPAAASMFADATLDLVFLDASHDVAAVAADLAAWAPKLKPGGVMAGHDHSARHPGVVAAVQAFASTRSHQIHVDASSVWSLHPSP